METKFNFKSQPATSIEQSERLLALGLKKETADMYYEGILGGELPKIMPHTSEMDHFQLWDSIIPAWSLNRLICLLPSCIRIKDYEYERKRIAVLNLVIDSFLEVGYIEGVDAPCYGIHFYANDVYNSIYRAIEWLIKEGYFNKDYLV